VMLKREASLCRCIISWQRTLWKNKEVERVFSLTAENSRTRWGVNNNSFQDLPAGKSQGSSILPPGDVRSLLMRLCLPSRSAAEPCELAPVCLQQGEAGPASSRRGHKWRQRFARNKACVWDVQSAHVTAWEKTWCH